MNGHDGVFSKGDSPPDENRDDTFAGMDTPRIRHITGLRIHQITLPDPVPGPSTQRLRRTSSPPERPGHLRERSISSTTISLHTQRSRTGTIVGGPGGRTRAPTLAGEALEHAKEVSAQVDHEADRLFKPKRLARTFIVLRLPLDSLSKSKPTPTPVSSRKGKERANENGHGHGHGVDSPDGYHLRPSLSTSSSSRSAHRDTGRSTPTRSSSQNSLPTVYDTEPIGDSKSKSGPMKQSSSLSAAGIKPNGQSTHTAPIPFFISPVHPPSTHPQSLALETGDFAPWLTVEEAAGGKAVLEIWYEDLSLLEQDGQDDDGNGEGKDEEGGIRGHWALASQIDIDLSHLRRVDRDTSLPENTVLVTLSTDPRSIFYLPVSGITHSAEEKGQKGRGRAVSGVMERSKRETRMRKGVGLGGLHQLVNMQAVIADTRRSIAEVQQKIDILLKRDVDGRAIRRDVNERKSRVHWFNDRIAEIDRTTEEVHARITLRRQDLATRRTRLGEAEVADHSLQSRLSDLATEIHTSETDRLTLQPAIHHTRSQHVQTLDSLFPIQPLHAPSLLYSILDIPLPIPVGPKDPAPPLMMTLPTVPRQKVDERTTAAALGYVAMVVSILGNLSSTRKEGGLCYPVTCAGSRSLVKDTVSVMQGPRSFPLFAKGVERYRYEYAVFLLNKNIEMLMQEASIRLVDIRHTLPNLKALLLTLSSPTPPPARRPPPPSSRQTSQAYSIPHFTSPGKISSPAGASASSTTRNTRVGSAHLPSLPGSPVALGRRSRLGRAGLALPNSGDDQDGDRASQADTETETETDTATELGSVNVYPGPGSSVITSP